MPHIRLAAACFAGAALTLACSPDGLPGAGGGDASTLLFFPQNLAAPIKVLSQTADDVVATMTAGDLSLEDVSLDGEPYQRLRLPGFASTAPQGWPEVPGVEVMVEVPRGARLRFEIIERSAPVTRDLAHDIAFQYRLPFHNGESVYAKADRSAYAKVHGAEAVEILDESWAATEKIATIRFNPVRYDAARRQLTLTRHLKVHFWFEQGLGLTAADDKPPVGGQSVGLLRAFTLNSEAYSTRGSYAGSKLDLVIADESLKAPLQKYLEFKRSRGRQVKDVYVSRKTAQQIKDLMKQEYASATPPAHTLFIGNIDMIPAWPGSGDNSVTDFPYQTLDGGAQPDVSLGRVPAHDAAELDAWIAKAIARETQPRAYDDILLTAGNDVGMGCPTNVAAVGNKIKAAGGSVKLIQKFRSQGASTQDVIAGYNASPNVIVYDGHGYQQGMSEIPLLIKDLPQLTNQSFPIILDIACLNANWQGGARARNFAEMILLKAGSGAAGIMASGGSGYGHEYFQTIGEIMAQGRQKAAAGDHTFNEIGRVIVAAKARHGQQDRAYWNYYGDPASSVWEPPAGTQPQPQPQPQPSGGDDVPVFAALGNGDTSALLLGAAATRLKGMSYCLGDAATCRAAGATWLGMEAVKQRGDTDFYSGKAPLTLQSGMTVTLYAKTAAEKDLFRTVVIRGK